MNKTEAAACAVTPPGRAGAPEQDAAAATIARHPERGVLIQGTGGLRKVRFAVGGRGKSGGVRIVYYLFNESLPVFLLDMFAKSEKANLTKAERNALAKVARVIADGYGG